MYSKGKKWYRQPIAELFALDTDTQYFVNLGVQIACKAQYFVNLEAQKTQYLVDLDEKISWQAQLKQEKGAGSLLL